MSAVFKPGDGVPTQAGLPREEFWQTKQPLFRYMITCQGCGGTFSDDDKRRPFCGVCEPAPTSSPDTPEAGAAGERDALTLVSELRQAADSESGSSGRLRDRCVQAAKALETALRERDEARVGLIQLSNELGRKMYQITGLAAQLSSEQTSHAETRKALEPFAKAAAIVEWSQRATGHSYRDEAPFQSGLAWQEKDGSARTITYADLRRARASHSLTQENADG